MTDEPIVSRDATSLRGMSRTQLRSARQLVNRKGRDEHGLFLVEGVQAVREALGRPDLVKGVVVTDPDAHAALLELVAPERRYLGSAEELAQLSDTVTPQGIVAICAQLDATWHDLPDDPKLVVVCAQVRDPGNAGTVIRCADAFGADAVILTKGSVDLHNPKLVRASVGSIFHLPVLTGLDLDAALDELRSRGCQVLAADGGGDSLDALAAAGELTPPTAWLMGNEAWGLPEHERSLADRIVGVPMWGRAESLNLSTAAAVCLYATASAQRA